MKILLSNKVLVTALTLFALTACGGSSGSKDKPKSSSSSSSTSSSVDVSSSSSSSDGSSPALVIYEEDILPNWKAWDCCLGTTPVALVTSEVEHGKAVRFSIGGNGETVVGFTSRTGHGAVDGASFNATSIKADGVIRFDLKLTKAPTASGVIWKFKVESNGGGDGNAAEVDLSSSQEGHSAPVLNTWQTYTFKLSDLETAGVNLAGLDVFMIFPAWGTGSGAEFEVDNVHIWASAPQDNSSSSSSDASESSSSESSSSSVSSAGVVIYEEDALEGWVPWDCCLGSNPSTTDAAEAEHGKVVRFSIGAGGATVVGFSSREGDGAVNGVAFDATDIKATGTLSFDLKLITAPDQSDVNWLLKVENTNGSFAEVDLSSSHEGHSAPELDTWQTYTFNLSTLEADGLDVDAIALVLIFPVWGTGEGAVYEIDNVKILETGAISD